MDTLKFVSVGLKISLIFYEEAKDYYKRIFNQIDTDENGTLDFHQFQQLILKIKPDLEHWKIFAIF